MFNRNTLANLFFVCAFLLLSGRFFYWQVIKGGNYKLQAENQYKLLKENQGERGRIYTKDGFGLVLNKNQYLLYLDPKLLELRSDELSKKLSESLGKQIDIDISNPKSRWIPLAKNLSEEDKEKISALNIAGLGFEASQSRFYPEASMAGQLLGFVGKDESGQPKGYFGLEGYYENELRGRANLSLFEMDALSRPISFSSQKDLPTSGRSLVTTIDRPIQYLIEKQLKEGIEKYGAVSGWAVILDPNSGAVIASAAYPTYNQELYYDALPDLYRNPVISSTFEPGSIFKVLIMAEALERNLVKPETVCDRCSGPREISNYTIKTWNEKYYPNTTMSEVILHSDNVGMVYVAEKLGVNNLNGFLQRLGFGEKTDIDLEGESYSKLRDTKGWADVDLATISFGQGIAVSPIQMVRAVNSIASGGLSYQPYIVEEIIEDEKRIKTQKNEPVRVFNQTTVNQITQMMVNAVDNGEAKWAKPKGYAIAGKTGTAQIPIAGHYDPTKTVASFIGFAPADKPRFTMLVSLVEPTTSPWGSETAAPLWFGIAKTYLEYGKSRQTFKHNCKVFDILISLKQSNL